MSLNARRQLANRCITGPPTTKPLTASPQITDLSPDTAAPPPETPFRKVRITAADRFLAGAVIVIALSGLLQVRAGFPRPAPMSRAMPAAPPIAPGPAIHPASGVPAPASGARLLLLGSTATVYDVVRNTAARPVSGTPPVAILSAITVPGGEVLVTPLGDDSGRALLVRAGRATVQLGIGTEVFAGPRPQTVWLLHTPIGMTGGTISLVSFTGAMLAGPFTVPREGRPEPGPGSGLLVAIGASGRPYRLASWDPATGVVGPPLATDAIADESGSGHVVISHSQGPSTLDGVVQTELPLLPVAVAFSRDGGEVAAVSDAGVLILIATRSREVREFSIPGIQPSSVAYAPSGWLFLSAGNRVLAVAPGALRAEPLPVVFSDPPQQVLVEDP